MGLNNIVHLNKQFQHCMKHLSKKKIIIKHHQSAKLSNHNGITNKQIIVISAIKRLLY